MAKKKKKDHTYPKVKFIYKPDEFNWHAQAACKDLPTEMFYYDDDERGPEKLYKERAALAVCNGCPVVKQCLQDAINRNDVYSIQGGTTPEQRGVIKGRITNASLRK